MRVCVLVSIKEKDREKVTVRVHACDREREGEEDQERKKESLNNFRRDCFRTQSYSQFHSWAATLFAGLIDYTLA